MRVSLDRVSALLAVMSFADFGAAREVVDSEDFRARAHDGRAEVSAVHDALMALMPGLNRTTHLRARVSLVLTRALEAIADD